MEQETKKWYESSSVIGGAVAVGSALLSLAGYAVSPADQVQLTGMLLAVGSAVGGVVAIVGRVRASKRIA